MKKRKVKEALVGRSHPNELEVGSRSNPYLLGSLKVHCYYPFKISADLYPFILYFHCPYISIHSVGLNKLILVSLSTKIEPRSNMPIYIQCLHLTGTWDVGQMLFKAEVGQGHRLRCFNRVYLTLINTFPPPLHNNKTR